MATLNEMLRLADFISINVPLTDETRGMISDTTIEMMKSHVLIINTSRGSVVDEGAVCRALEKQQIGGYATDVYESEPPGNSPLLGYPNVQCTPHIASYTEDSMRSLGDCVIEGIQSIFSGEIPEHILNREVLSTTVTG
jgi:D-3-phosphoglycerate dehydrogenase